MKVAASCLALLAAAATAVTVDVEYFPAAGCKTGGATVSVIAPVTKCYPIRFFSNSFEVSGTTKLPNGCTLKGFSEKDCKGFENQYIDGPSLGKCDSAANSNGKFASIQINCD